MTAASNRCLCNPSTQAACAKAGACQRPPAVTHVDAVVEENRRLLLARSQVGLAKYGTGLDNGGYTEEAILQHALEEALDLANYLQTRLMRIRGQLPPE